MGTQLHELNQLHSFCSCANNNNMLGACMVSKRSWKSVTQCFHSFIIMWQHKRSAICWCILVMKAMAAWARFLCFIASQGEQWPLFAPFYTPFCYAACLLHACSERLFGSGKRTECVCLKPSEHGATREIETKFQSYVCSRAIFYFLCCELQSLLVWCKIVKTTISVELLATLYMSSLMGLIVSFTLWLLVVLFVVVLNSCLCTCPQLPKTELHSWLPL